MPTQKQNESFELELQTLVGVLTSEAHHVISE